MSASTGPRKATASLFARSVALTYIVVAVASFAVVFGGLAALSVFATPGPTPPGTYAVIFVETGLPDGANFSVTFNGVTQSTITVAYQEAHVAFDVPNGTYSFSVAPVPGYTAVPSSGHWNVSGRATSPGIEFKTAEIPIGTAFGAGDPVLTTCPTGDTYAVDGCLAGDWVYRLTIEFSTVEFGDVWFSVKTDVGVNYTLPSGTGGFAILNVTGGLAAEVNPISVGDPYTMTTYWTVYGDSLTGTSPLTSLYSILLDVGTTSPTGLGLVFVVYGWNTYEGTTAPLSLP